MKDTLLWPMGALALWTLLLLALVPVVRIRAVRAGLAKARDFKFGESAAVPGAVSVPNRHYMNLLELPVLFYVASLAAMVTGRIDPWTVFLAWAFVGLRIAHSLVHLTYNWVLHRLFVFGLGVMVLAVYWIKILIGPS